MPDDGKIVSIAPLWNWKTGLRERPNSISGFQSHLYGIESSIGSSSSTRNFVSIAPLWNWKFVVSSGYRCEARFNRTFMELKVAPCSMELHAKTVSIAPLWNWKPRYRLYSELASGFNRTFMELKERDGNYPTPMSRFQSHLYGIERCVYLAGFLVTGVSIAPLWNWKSAAGLRLEVWYSFNRTFMELKESSNSGIMKS